MPAFVYRVARPDGTTLEGQAEGENEVEVRSRLESQGVLIFSIRRLGRWSFVGGIGLFARKTWSLEEFLVFNQEFLALLKAGLPILKIWDLLIERTRKPEVQKTLRATRHDVRGGASMSEALAHHPGCFPELYIATVRAGEQSGNLPEVLQRYISYLKMMIGLRQKMTKALAYPAFLVIVAMAVIAFLLMYVLPTFSAIYGDVGSALPPATRFLIALVHSLQAHIVVAVAAIVGFAIAFRMWLRTKNGRFVWDKAILRVPIVGDALMKHYTIQFSRTLATVLSGGTPLVTALHVVRGAVSNQFLSANLITAVQRVREGGTLAAAMEERHLLPRLALEMIGVGEETGSLESMLRDVAELYEGDLDQQLSRLTTWIEPALLLVMGILVGVIVIVMYLPIFQMAGTVR